MSVPIDVSHCWPQYIQQSKTAAQKINLVIDKYPWATQNLAQRFASVMASAKKANFCPFVPGTGPIIEESHAVLKEASALAANPPAPPAPPPPATLPAYTQAAPYAQPAPSTVSTPLVSTTAPTVQTPGTPLVQGQPPSVRPPIRIPGAPPTPSPTPTPSETFFKEPVISTPTEGSMLPTAIILFFVASLGLGLYFWIK